MEYWISIAEENSQELAEEAQMAVQYTLLMGECELFFHVIFWNVNTDNMK